MPRSPERDTAPGRAPAGESASIRGKIPSSAEALRRVLAIGLAVLAGVLPVHAWGGRTTLARKYRPGQKMVYQSSIQTRATVHSQPEGLKALLPPLPTELGTQQQNTVTVRAVQADGAAEVENRFDRFEFRSNLPDLLPEELKETTRVAQEEFGKRLNGQTLTARYDRQGRLLDFDGADPMLEQLDDPLRETARQVLRMFLEQMGGNALYPDHRVKPGEEWRQKLNAAPTGDYPFSVEGENALKFVGKTRYQGVKAGIIDFRFTNVIRPSSASLRQSGPIALLRAQGMALDLKIEGQGEGRALVALDDGRILQNRTTLQQVLKARVDGAPGIQLPVEGPLTLDVNSETRLEVDAASEPLR